MSFSPKGKRNNDSGVNDAGVQISIVNNKETSDFRTTVGHGVHAYVHLLRTSDLNYRNFLREAVVAAFRIWGRDNWVVYRNPFEQPPDPDLVSALGIAWRVYDQGGAGFVFPNARACLEFSDEVYSAEHLFFVLEFIPRGACASAEAALDSKYVYGEYPEVYVASGCAEVASVVHGEARAAILLDPLALICKAFSVDDSATIFAQLLRDVS